MTLISSILAVLQKICKIKINADLKILYSWLLANKISLNCDKTEIIFFHKPGEKIPDLKIKMNGHRIFPSKFIKYLGIYLDETLNGRFHCHNLAKKLNRANGMLCKARHFINSEDLKILYYAIFSSHLIYGCQIWGQHTNIFNRRVFKLQNRALRIISFANFCADSTPLYHNLNIIALSDHITIQNCLFVHDTIKKISPVCFHDYFVTTQNIHPIYTKSSSLGCLYVNKNNTVRYGLNSITHTCISQWNFLTKKINCDLSSLSRSKLKSALKAYFINTYN